MIKDLRQHWSLKDVQISKSSNIQIFFEEQKVKTIRCGPERLVSNINNKKNVSFNKNIFWCDMTKIIKEKSSDNTHIRYFIRIMRSICRNEWLIKWTLLKSFLFTLNYSAICWLRSKQNGGREYKHMRSRLYANKEVIL